MLRKNFNAICILASIFTFFFAMGIVFTVLCKKLRFDFSEDLEFNFEDEAIEPIIVNETFD